MNPLPIIPSCDGCGACCMEQGSPPGYVMLLQAPKFGSGENNPFADDLQRVLILPQEAIEELKAYERRLLAGGVAGDGPCIWLDMATRQCRHYELRPSICRHLEIGSSPCRSWREAYRTFTT